MQVNNAGIGGLMVEGDVLFLKEIIMGDDLRISGQVKSSLYLKFVCFLHTRDMEK